MFDHVGLRVRNLAAASDFYRNALAALGHEPGSRGADYAGFGPPGEPALWLYANAQAGAGTHLAFRAADRAAVQRFYRQGLAAGGRDNGEPGLRADYAPNYYAAFLLDPDGNNVEAVCFE